MIFFRKNKLKVKVTAFKSASPQKLLGYTANHCNLRLGSYSQTLVILQLTSLIGLLLGSFLRFNWLEKINYGQLIMLANVALVFAIGSCFLGLPLGYTLFFKLIGIILSGYMAPITSRDHGNV